MPKAAKPKMARATRGKVQQGCARTNEKFYRIVALFGCVRN